MRWLLLHAIVLFTSLAGHAQLRVVTSASIFADMIRNIGGGHVEVIQLVPTGADPHSYEPIPADITLINRADLIMLNGLTFELWIEKMISHVNPGTPIILLTEGIEPLESADYPGAPDPHAWLDPVAGMEYLANIYRALAEAIPGEAETLKDNYEIYKAQLAALHAECEAMAALVPPGQRKLITSHDAFRYFGQRYGFTVFAAMGTSTDADIRIADIMQLSKAIREHGIRAVFIESTINPQLMMQIARDYNIVVGGELYADSLSEPGKPADTWLGMLRHNMETIVNGLILDTESSGEDSATALSAWLGLISFLLIAFCLTWRKIDHA